MDSKLYYNVRSSIKDGDVILYRYRNTEARLVSLLDNAFYTHAGIVKWTGNKLLTIDIWKHGTEIIPLSRRIKKSHDFCILRPIAEEYLIGAGIISCIEEIEREERKDNFSLIRTLILKHTGIDLIDKNTITNSQFIKNYFHSIGTTCYSRIQHISPNDLLRYADPKEISIIYDESPHTAKIVHNKVD